MGNIIEIKTRLHDECMYGILDAYKKFNTNNKFIDFVNSDKIKIINEYIERLSKKIDNDNKHVDILYKNAYQFGFLIYKRYINKND